MTREEAFHLLARVPLPVPLKLPPQAIARGIAVLVKYDEDIHFRFEHDRVWAANFDQTLLSMSVDDLLELNTCGWFHDQGSWSHFE